MLAVGSGRGGGLNEACCIAFPEVPWWIDEDQLEVSHGWAIREGVGGECLEWQDLEAHGLRDRCGINIDRRDGGTIDRYSRGRSTTK